MVRGVFGVRLTALCVATPLAAFAFGLIPEAVGADITSSTEVAQGPMSRPPSGYVYHNYCIGKHDPLPDYANKWISCGYVVDIPGFPLPLFSDSSKRDVTTAHLTWCAPGQYDGRSGQSRFKATFYYDNTPDGAWSDFETLTAKDDPDVQTLGGDTSGWYVGSLGYAKTTVDRAVAISGADGTTVQAPSEKGTKWYVTWKNTPEGLDEIWVFAYTE